jgi:hypothetical protein
MSLSNRLSYKTMTLYTAIALAFSLLISLPIANAATAPFTSYQGCTAYVGPVFSRHSVGAIRQNYINPLIAGRLTTLNSLLPRVATLSPDQVAVLTNGINADKQVLTDIQTKDKTVTDIHVLRDDYCQAVYKTQVNQFRVPQVTDLQRLDKRLLADSKLSTALSKQGTTSRLQPAIDERLAAAKDLIATNLNTETIDIPAVLNAAVSFDGANYVNNLPVLSKASFDTLDKNFQVVYTKYTEIVVLKIAGGGFNPNKSLTLVSLSLNKDGQPVTNPSDANKAVAKIQVGGGTTYNRTIARKDKNFVWHVESTKPAN